MTPPDLVKGGSPALVALLLAVRERHKKCRDGRHVGSGASRDIRECWALAVYDAQGTEQ